MPVLAAVSTICRMCPRILIKGERWSSRMTYEQRQRIISTDKVIEITCPFCGGA